MTPTSEDYGSLYPEPPHDIYASPCMSTPSAPGSNLAYYQQHPQGPDYGYMAATTGYAEPSMMTGLLSLSPSLHEGEFPELDAIPSSSSSGPSAPSSAVGSPRSYHTHAPTLASSSVSPHVVHQGDFFAVGEYGFGAPVDEYQFEFPMAKGFVDPSILHSEVRPMGVSTFDSYTPYQQQQQQQQQHFHAHAHLQQPQPQHAHLSPYATSPVHSPLLGTDAHSPYPSSSAGQFASQFSPFLAPTPMPMSGAPGVPLTVSMAVVPSPTPASRASMSRASMSRASISGASISGASRVSRVSSVSSASYANLPRGHVESLSDGDDNEKQKCPHPECGRRYKDLRAHMLTHLNERPEKCPIATCEYHTKGFARKYDKNRHTLTHYKGTMVCGFCPGSGSPAEKSFNRADVFKRHLTAMHGVEQTPPNSRKKMGSSGSPGGGSVTALSTYAPDATGKCSTCTATFSNAQEFYEHLDDCVLRIVQLEDPAEAVNASRLAEVEHDSDVIVTLEKNRVLGVGPETATPHDDDDEEEDEDGTPASPGKQRNRVLAGGIVKSRGMTHSRGGVPFTGKTRVRRSRHNYPTSWGFDKGQMTMRKRVMTVFEGRRRLAKDDMMLSTEHEVRLQLSDGKAYVTDLDVQTLKRAEGFLGATDEEKGPWVSDDPTEAELQQMASL